MTLMSDGSVSTANYKTGRRSAHSSSRHSFAEVIQRESTKEKREWKATNNGQTDAPTAEKSAQDVNWKTAKPGVNDVTLAQNTASSKMLSVSVEGRESNKRLTWALEQLNLRSPEENRARMLRNRSLSKLQIPALLTKEVTLLELIGKGSSSRVWKGETKQNQLVAIKIVRRRDYSKHFIKWTVDRELRILSCLNHPNIIRFVDSIVNDQLVIIITEWCENGDLANHIIKKGPPETAVTQKWIGQIIYALKYLHDCKAAHRDLKCENILLDNRKNAKIADFGFSRMIVDQQGQEVLSSTFCGSFAYVAPEVIQMKAYDARVADLWSVGIILYAMCYAKVPFEDSCRDSRRLNVPFPQNVQVNAQCLDLIKRLLKPVSDRITMGEVLEHEFILLSPAELLS